MQTLRAKVAFWDIDREMAPDIAAAKDLVNSALFRDITPLRVVA
jgi:histidine ammonia-lyase